MKKGLLIALAVALLLGLGAAVALADSSARPFKGRVPGADSLNTGTCSDPGPLGFPCLLYRVEGQIIATHLGEGKYTAEVSIDMENGWPDPHVPTATCGSWLPEDSTFTFVAANGDELYGSFSGHSCYDLATEDSWGTVQGEFTGGTGRFEGAVGTVEKEFWSDADTEGLIASLWDGWIGY